MSQKQWLVGGLVPGLARDPQKKLPPDAPRLLAQVERWRAEAAKAGRVITRICVAYEAGRDGFWLARWLRERGIECHSLPRQKPGSFIRPAFRCRASIGGPRATGLMSV
jgi:transposase